MKVLLRSTESGLYFQSNEHWTDEAGEALNFEGCARAVEKFMALKLSNVEIVLWFGDPELDMTIPLSGGGGGGVVREAPRIAGKLGRP